MSQSQIGELAQIETAWVQFQSSGLRLGYMSDAIRAAVHAEVDEKINAGTRLENAIERLSAAELARDEAQKAVTVALRDALSAGWSERQLKSLGLVPNPPRARGRSRRAAAPVHAHEND